MGVVPWSNIIEFSGKKTWKKPTTILCRIQFFAPSYVKDGKKEIETITLGIIYKPIVQAFEGIAVNWLSWVKFKKTLQSTFLLLFSNISRNMVQVKILLLCNDCKDSLKKICA